MHLLSTPIHCVDLELLQETLHRIIELVAPYVKLGTRNPVPGDPGVSVQAYWIVHPTLSRCCMTVPGSPASSCAPCG